SPFLEGDVYLSTQSINKLQDHARFGLDDAFHHDFAGSIPDRDRDAFLVHVHADIFTASHKGGAPFWMVWDKHQNLTPKRGAPLYCVFLFLHQEGCWGCFLWPVILPSTR